jgi:hypothetical protein
MVVENPTISHAEPERIQLQLVLPYKFQPREDPQVRAYLERGFRIDQLQRISDQEVLVTLLRPPATPPQP